MDKIKKYGGWGLGVLALLLLATSVVKAGLGGYLIHVDTWSGNLESKSGLQPDIRLGADDGTHLTKLTVVETLDVSSTAVFGGALSIGGTLTVQGALTLNGALAVATSTRLVSLVETGSIATFTATTTATAAQVCDRTLWSLDAQVSGISITLPASSSLFADCLTTSGDVRRFTIYNTSLFASAIVAGTGGVMDFSTSTTGIIPTGASADLIIFRTSTLGYRASMIITAD